MPSTAICGKYNVVVPSYMNECMIKEKVINIKVNRILSILFPFRIILFNISQ